MSPPEEREILRMEYPRDLPGTTLIHAVNNSTRWRMHHEAYLIYLMRDGGGTWNCGGRSHRTEPGRSGWMCPGDFHQVTSLDPCGSTREPGTTQSCLVVAPELVGRAALELGLNPARIGLGAGVSTDPRVSVRLRRFFSCARSERSPLAVQSALAKCLEALVGLLPKPAVNVLGGRAGRRAVRRAQEILRSESARPVGLEELAEETGYTKFQLLRAFKADLGITPHQFLIQVRLGKARELLARGIPSAIAAVEAGFADQAHFIRHFKRWWGVSPVRFRPRKP